MRIQKREEISAAGDMTPMIDMTFQLIAFFMVLINFTEAEQNQQIKLPESELAKPPEGPFEHPITLQVTKDSTVLMGGEAYKLSSIKTPLDREVDGLRRQNKSPGDATVIIRADMEAQTGDIQLLILECQKAQLTTFALRAKEKVGH